MTDSQSLDSANQASESQWTQRRLNVKAAHFDKSQQTIPCLNHRSTLPFLLSFLFFSMYGRYVFVCVCTYVRACMCVCTYRCECVRVCSHIHVCMHIAHVCTCVYIHMCVHACMFLCVNVQMCMHVCVCTYVCACVSGAGGGLSLNQELFWLV